MTSRARVALLRTTPATVLHDYARLFELADLPSSLDISATTTLVLDRRRYFPFPSANTTPWQLDGVLRALGDAGYHDRVCIQPKTSLADILKGQDLNGYMPILHAHGVADTAQQQVLFRPTHTLPMLERLCGGDLSVPATLVGANIIYLPTLKTDRAATLGGAACCAAASLLPNLPHLARGQLHSLLADLLSMQRELAAGVAAVMDGTTAGDGLGPYALRPEIRNVLLASSDPIALDAAAARLIGFDPLDLAYLRLAQERGLGVADPRAIELVGDIDLAQECWHVRAGEWLGSTLFGMIERLVAYTPLADLLVIGKASYHDFYRWPLAERPVFESWLHHSAWGRLFEDYQRQGYGRASEPG
jgi:hypothetical protein